jgi:hypothetical protein
MNPTTATRTTTHTCTGEMYEAAFSTTGPHPLCGVALTRSIEEARQRLADMLLLVDPRHHAVADITRLIRGDTVETYDGTTGDIFAQVNNNDEPVPYAVTARPLTPATAAHTTTTVVCHRCGTPGPSGPTPKRPASTTRPRRPAGP